MNNHSGRIFQINVSHQGGVPKRALRSAWAGELGLEGDAQNDMIHHGGPDRALCLYSLEQILELQAEGHPVFPGSVGENITTVGIDLSTLGPGAQISLGSDVVIEITSYTAPCRTIQESFTDHHFVRISQKVNPGSSRLYARVLKSGQITTGDVLNLTIQSEQSS